MGPRKKRSLSALMVRVDGSEIARRYTPSNLRGIDPGSTLQMDRAMPRHGASDVVSRIAPDSAVENRGPRNFGPVA